MTQVIAFLGPKKRGRKVRMGPLASVARIRDDHSNRLRGASLQCPEAERFAQLVADRHLRLRAEREPMFADTPNLIAFPPTRRPPMEEEPTEPWVAELADAIAARAREIIAVDDRNRQ